MEFHLDPGASALVLIDLQNGILARPLAPYDRAAVLAAASRLGRAFAAAGGLIVPVRVTFSADGGDRLTQPVDTPMMPGGGLPADWATLAPEIAALPAAVSITKRQWSAFHGTELDLQLRRRAIRNVVVCGVSTNFGVESTAREAWQHGYGVVIAEDACASADAALHEFAISRILPRVARVRKVAEIAAALSQAV